MKKLLVFLILAFVMAGYAQEGSLKPEFQAFSGALVKLKRAKGGYHKFLLQIESAPWAFSAEGEVAAPGGDPELLITALFDGDLYAVLAYVPSATSGSDGLEYQVGLFDMMLYYEEEPTKIRNLSFKLLPPANDDWAMSAFSDVQNSSSLLGEIWKGKYDREITKASATPLDKKTLRAMKKEAEDAAAAAEEQKRLEQEKKNAKVKGKKPKNVDECDSSNLSAKEKRRCQMQKKKKKKKKKL